MSADGKVSGIASTIAKITSSTGLAISGSASGNGIWVTGSAPKTTPKETSYTVQQTVGDIDEDSYTLKTGYIELKKQKPHPLQSTADTLARLYSFIGRWWRNELSSNTQNKLDTFPK